MFTTLIYLLLNDQKKMCNSILKLCTSSAHTIFSFVFSYASFCRFFIHIYSLNKSKKHIHQNTMLMYANVVQFSIILCVMRYIHIQIIYLDIYSQKKNDKLAKSNLKLLKPFFIVYLSDEKKTYFKSSKCTI